MDAGGGPEGDVSLAACGSVLEGWSVPIVKEGGAGEPGKPGPTGLCTKWTDF